MSDETNELSTREQRVNELIAAYLEAVDAGEAPDAKEFIAAHRDGVGVVLCQPRRVRADGRTAPAGRWRRGPTDNDGNQDPDIKAFLR